MHQLRYLPLLLLDLLFVPGTLGDGDDDGTEAARRDHLVAEEEAVDLAIFQEIQHAFWDEARELAVVSSAWALSTYK